MRGPLARTSRAVLCGRETTTLAVQRVCRLVSARSLPCTRYGCSHASRHETHVAERFVGSDQAPQACSLRLRKRFEVIAIVRRDLELNFGGEGEDVGGHFFLFFSFLSWRVGWWEDGEWVKGGKKGEDSLALWTRVGL